jgi:hypothetical protein
MKNLIKYLSTAPVVLLGVSLLGNPTEVLAQRHGSSGGHAPAPHRSSPASHPPAPRQAVSRAQSGGLSPQCREARQNATISGAAAVVAAGTCFATRNPAPCAAAGIAAVKWAVDTQKMIKVCQPPPAPRRASPRVTSPRRGR